MRRKDPSTPAVMSLWKVCQYYLNLIGFWVETLISSIHLNIQNELITYGVGSMVLPGPDRNVSISTLEPLCRHFTHFADISFIYRACPSIGIHRKYLELILSSCWREVTSSEYEVLIYSVNSIVQLEIKDHGRGNTP